MRSTLILALMLLAACDDGAPDGPPGAPAEAELARFGSERAFDDYMDRLRAQRAGEGGSGGSLADAGAGEGGGAGGAGGAGGGDFEGAAEDGPPENEEITNNQEQGVDEGGIVKNIGHHLVFLRKGRLYAADVSTPGAPRQSDTVAVASEAELNNGVWYDEMLVRGRVIFVVGYRYVAAVEGAEESDFSWIFGATEISAFLLDEAGRLHRRGTTFIESNDYFSGSNYASRMIGGQLVFYMPFAAFVYDWMTGSEEVHIPQVLTHLGQGRFRAERPLFGGRDVAHGAVPPENPVFHTVVTCEVGTGGELAADALDCRARSLLGEWGRQYYVTAEDVFIWTAGQAFAVSLDDGAARAHAVEGEVSSQFNLKVSDGALHATVERWEPVDPEDEWGAYDTVLEHLVLPLAAFDGEGAQPLDTLDRIELARYSGWASPWVARYVDGWYLGAVSVWDPETGESTDEILALRLEDRALRRLSTEGTPTRIEAMPGIGALVVSSSGAGMDLTTLRLDTEPTFLAPAHLPGTAEAEYRSHGFFFRPTEGGGRFGLATLGASGGEDGWWGSGVGNLAFFTAGRDGAIGHLGTVSSSPAGEGVCETSCVDWYGNTRPIFLGDRAFAMMGSELVEIALDDSLREVGERLVLSR